MTLSEYLQPDPALTEANENCAPIQVGMMWTGCKGPLNQAGVVRATLTKLPDMQNECGFLGQNRCAEETKGQHFDKLNMSTVNWNILCRGYLFIQKTD